MDTAQWKQLGFVFWNLKLEWHAEGVTVTVNTLYNLHTLERTAAIRRRNEQLKLIDACHFL